MSNEFGHVIQYCDGFAWGITPAGETVCLGTADAVKAALANPKLHSCREEIDGIIELERKLIQEEMIGESRIQVKSTTGKRAVGTGGFRSRPPSNSQFKPVSTRHLKARKGVPGREAVPATPRLPD